MDKKVITVDCDGVIMENLGGRNWTNQVKIEPETGWYPIVNLWWATMNHRWRRPLPGIESVLKKIKGKGYELILVTSRKEYLRPITMWWLKKWGLDKYFDGFYFNNFGVTAAESKVKNIEKISPVAHVDDNEATVRELNLEFNNLRIYWLNPKPPVLRQAQDTPLEEGGLNLDNIIRVESWDEIATFIDKIGEN